MTRHQRKGGHTPIIVDQVQVRVADAAVRDRDIDFAGQKRAEGVAAAMRRARGAAHASMDKFSVDGAATAVLSDHTPAPRSHDRDLSSTHRAIAADSASPRPVNP